MNSSETAAEQYAARLKQRQETSQELEKLHIRVGYLRLIFAIAAAYAAYAALFRGASPLYFVAGVACFAASVVWHSRISRRLTLAQRSLNFYERGLARLSGDFSRPVSSGDRFADPHHLFSGDLDVFGRGGLFERICHARTRQGEGTLAQWLLELAGPPVATQRLEAVEELAGQVDLQEQLAIAGPDVEVAVQPDVLRRWVAERTNFPNWVTPVRWLCILLSFGAIGVAASYGLFGTVLLVMVLGALLKFILRHRLHATLHATSDAATNLRILESVLRLLEDASFRSPFLIDVQSRIRQSDEKASAAIGRLARLAEWIDSLDNEFFQPFDAMFLFSIGFAQKADQWRQKHEKLVPVWMEALGAFEAIVSFSTWRYENPDVIAPEWVKDGPMFEGREIQHPLIVNAVSNDVALGIDQQLLLVSGSNMSGKSTLLRTVGIQVMLAHAGAHVPALELKLSPMRLGASIRTVDSLQEGVSRFYAELQRLKAVVDASKSATPLIFLLDELLSGTNSHDRRIGAEGILRTLMGNGAIGLVTTHDLALAEIGDGVAITNVHFDDQVLDGRLHFDYRMKPGIVQTSNALKLMRAVGLDVANP